jgi:transcription termination/antitermination protein NusG
LRSIKMGINNAHGPAFIDRIIMEKNRETHWYAVHVKARHEFKVWERLKDAGIVVFLPAIERLRKWKDRKKIIQFPLFPCYLFVNIRGSHEDRLAVLKTKGVVRFLGSASGEPEPIPEEQIFSLQQVIQSKMELDPYPYLQEGNRVRISRGPLAGIEGILVEKAGQHKLILSIDILCQSTAVTIDASEVDKA